MLYYCFVFFFHSSDTRETFLNCVFKRSPTFTTSKDNYFMIKIKRVDTYNKKRYCKKNGWVGKKKHGRGRD